MNGLRVYCAALVLATMPIGGHATSILYDIDLDIGAGNVSGTIATNGTMGFLEQADILTWNLTVFDGFHSFSLDAATDSLETSQLIFATAGELVLDFNQPFTAFLHVMRYITPFEYIAVDAFVWADFPGGGYGYTHEVILPEPSIHTDQVHTTFPHIVDFGTASPVVPVPAAVWLLMSAMGLLAGFSGTRAFRRQ